MTAAVLMGSVMIAVILLIRGMALRRLPKWLFRVLWIIAAVRLVLPWSLTVEVKVPAASHELVQILVQLGTDRASAAVRQAAEAAGDVPSITAESVIFALYIVGIVITAGFFLLAYARLRKIAHKAEKRFVRGVEICAGDGFDSPFSCGIFHPVIYIPSGMLSLTQEQLDCVLAHERCHIRRGDQAVKWLILTAVCIHWWNPMAWLMLRYASRDIELACDEVVARHADPAGYALCLIAAEEVRSVAPINAFGSPAIRERIECIMKAKHLTICGFVCAAALLAAMTPFFIKVDAVESGETTDLTAVTPDAVMEYNVSEDVSYEVDGESAETVTVDVSAAATEEISEEQTISLVFPLSADYYISQGYSDKHPAVDLAADKGSDILATANGTVTMAQYQQSLGNVIYLDHGDGFVSIYAHCDALFVEVGDDVSAGDVIAKVGQTGDATGPHLHFAMTQDDECFLPDGLFDEEDFPKRPF